MLFDIYFHNDFDGRAAAAIMLSFLRERGDDIEHFTPIDYDIIDQWLHEDFFEKHKLFKGKRNPAIVVDFAFHPKTAWWFDHHGSTFRKESWKKKFKPTRFWHYNPEYASCCGQVAAVLKKEFGWKQSPIFKELIKWGDILDGARYDSPQQTIERKEPALQVATFFGASGDKELTRRPFIELLAMQPLAAIAKRPEVKKAVAIARKETANDIAFYKKHLKIFGETAYIDLSRKKKSTAMRYISYYLHPEILYMVRVMKERNDLYHASVGANPWRRNENDIDIGKLLQSFGGGGHFNVGNTDFKTRKEALAVAQQSIEYIKKHHHPHGKIRKK